MIMFETLTFLTLGAAYIFELIQESKEREEEERQEKIRDLKIKVFCYAIRHGLLYNEVVKKIERKELSIKDIEHESKENKNERTGN